MYQITFILVNDSATKGSGSESRHRFFPHVGHSIEVNCRDHSKQLDELVKLRQQWPEAKILGVSELDVSASHAPVRVNPEMNALRRAVSDLP